MIRSKAELLMILLRQVSNKIHIVIQLAMPVKTIQLKQRKQKDMCRNDRHLGGGKETGTLYSLHS